MRFPTAAAVGLCIFAGVAAPALADDCSRARALYDQGTRAVNYADKAEIYQEAVGLCPGYAEARNNLADALQNLGRLDEAVSEYREALRINPAMAAAHFGLGEVFLQMGLYEQAASSLREGLALYPTDSRAQADLIRAERGCIEAGVDGRPLSAAEIVAARSRLPVSTMGPGGVRVRTVRIRFPNILFDKDKDSIKDASRVQIYEIRRALGSPELASVSFMIEGHASGDGDEAHNLDLSRRRAASVRNALLAGTAGDLPSRVRTQGYGETRLLAAPERTPADRERNRRVEVIIIEPEAPTPEAAAAE